MAEQNETPRSFLGVVLGLLAAMLFVPWSGGGPAPAPSRSVEPEQRSSDDEAADLADATAAFPGAVDHRPLLEHLGLPFDPNRDRAQSRGAIRKGLRDQQIDVTTLVMCVADPVASSNGYRTDLQLETLQKSLTAWDYVADRWWLPWTAVEKQGKPPASAGIPGVMLFRGAGKAAGTRRLLVVYLVAELMTSGIDRPALARALSDAASLAAAADNPPRQSALPILGPVFSGSTDSLALALREFPENADQPGLVVINFSATAFNRDRYEELLGSRRVPYGATITGFDEQRRQLLAYVREKRPSSRIAWLQEAGTGLSAGTRSERPGAGPAAADAERPAKEPACPSISDYVFPAGIAQVRDAYAKASASGRSTSLTSPTDRTLMRFPTDAQAAARDLVPRFSAGMQGPYTELSLRHLLLDIARDDFDAVGITATDHRDRLFLVQQLRQHAPEVQILLVGGDLAYEHPAHRQAMLGALVASSYPPFTAHHLWPAGRVAAESRLALPTQANSALFNAVSLGLDMARRPADPAAAGRDARRITSHQLSDQAATASLRHYDVPFPAGGSSLDRPPVWISTIGYQGAWPLRWVPAASAEDSAKDSGVIGVKQQGLTGGLESVEQRIELSGVQRNPMPLTQIVALLLVLSMLTTVAVRGGFEAGRAARGPGPQDWAVSDEWIRALGDWWQPATVRDSPHPDGRSWRLGGPLAVVLLALWVPATAAAAVALAGLIAGGQPDWNGRFASLDARWPLVWFLAATWLLAPWRIPHAVRLVFVTAAVAGCFFLEDSPKDSTWLLVTTVLAATASLHLLAGLVRVGWQARSRSAIGAAADYWLTLAASLATICLLFALVGWAGDVATRLPWLLTSAWVFNGISPLLPLTASGLALAALWYAELVRSWRADEAPVASSLGLASRDPDADRREQAALRYPLLGRHAAEWVGSQLQWSFVRGAKAAAPTPIGLLQFIFLLGAAVWLAVLAWKLTPVYPDRLSHPACVVLLVAAFLSWALLMVRAQALVGRLFDALHRFRREVDQPGAMLEEAFRELHRPADVLLGRMLYSRRPPPTTLDDVEPFFAPPADGSMADRQAPELAAAKKRAIGMKRFVRSLGGQIRWLIAGLAVGAVLLFVAATSLPCQPRSVLLVTSTLSFIAFAWLSVGTLLRIERDPVLSLIAHSVGGRVTWDMQTLVKVALPVGVPVLLIVGQAFPEAWQWFGALAEGWRGS